MKNYWTKRNTQTIVDNEKKGNILEQKLLNTYKQTIKDINTEIEAFYQRYGTDNKLSLAEVKKKLNKSRLSDFRQDAKSYITWVDRLDDKMFIEPYRTKIKELSARAYISKMNALELNVISKIDQLTNTTNVELKNTLSEGFNRAYNNTVKGFGYNPTNLNQDVVKKILDTKWQNGNFSSRIWDNRTKLINQLNKVIPQEFIKGSGSEKVARVVSERLNVNFSNVKRVIRTEINYVSNKAVMQGYEDSGITEYEFMAILDNRTSETCSELDGKKFNIKDGEAGINLPPLHPYCRSTTIPVGIEEETEINDDLNSITESDTIKARKEVNGIKLDVGMFPDEFNSKTEIKNTQLMCNFINKLEDADPDVLQLYSKIRQMESITSKGATFKISHASSNSVSYRLFRGSLSDVKLTIPKLSGENLTGQINTTLHENMHLIDLHLRDKSTGIWFSNTAKVLNNSIDGIAKDIKMNLKHNRRYGIPDDMQKLFKEYHDECDKIRSTARKVLTDAHNVILSKYTNKEITHTDYKKERKKLSKVCKDRIDYEQRNALGGGICDLEDIYDALSYGYYWDKGIVKYGHGSGYYSKQESRAKEIIANYGALSITRPDLIEHLKKDKPNLVGALEETIQAMLKEVE